MKLKKAFKNQQANGNAGEEEKFKDSERWRDLVSYWIFGMCNNYGYVIMLSAAHDIIKSLDSNTDVSGFSSLFFYKLTDSSSVRFLQTFCYFRFLWTQKISNPGMKQSGHVNLYQLGLFC